MSRICGILESLNRNLNLRPVRLKIVARLPIFPVRMNDNSHTVCTLLYIPYKIDFPSFNPRME